MRSPIIASLGVAALVAACNSRGDLNGPGITAAADITGKWAGHGDGQQSFDSMAVTLTQHANDSLTGGGVFWFADSPRPVKIAGVRLRDSVIVSMPDSAGTAPDTLEFLAGVTKDSFGDELFGSVGTGNFNATTGITFALHRRP